MTSLSRFAKWAMYVLWSFLFILIAIAVSAGLPFVPFESLEQRVFSWSFISILLIFLLILSVFKGTEKQPAGFHYLAAIFKKGDYKQCFLSLIAIPACSAGMGYFVYIIVATIPAYPSKYVESEPKNIDAVCLETGRDKYRGSWSMFKLANGESWKVAGYGHICPTNQLRCKISYDVGLFGYYVRNIQCH